MPLGNYEGARYVHFFGMAGIVRLHHRARGADVAGAQGAAADDHRPGTRLDASLRKRKGDAS